MVGKSIYSTLDDVDNSFIIACNWLKLKFRFISLSKNVGIIILPIVGSLRSFAIDDDSFGFNASKA